MMEYILLIIFTYRHTPILMPYRYPTEQICNNAGDKIKAKTEGRGGMYYICADISRKE